MRLRVVLLVVFLGICSARSLAEAFKAGAAKALITPDIRARSVYLAGFGHNRVATATHDDLYIRCLALGTDSILVLCSADLIGLFYQDVKTIRNLFAAATSRNCFLIVASTHVHEGPDTLGLWGPTPTQTGVSTQYLDWVEHRIAKTARQAVLAMQPAQLELARDDYPLLQQLQAVDRPPYILDPYLFIMRLTALRTGQPIATLVNWGDHAETLDRGNTSISADYPHWLCQYLEDHLGGTAIFFNGTVGKISTLGVTLRDTETGQLAANGTWRKSELLGNMLGRLSERAMKSAEHVDVDRIAVHTSTVFLRLQNDRFRVADALGLFGSRRPLYTNGRRDRSTEDRKVEGLGQLKYPLGHDLETEVDYIQICSGGTAIAEVATVPGEIYPELVNGGISRYPGADYPEAPFEPALRAHFLTRYQFIFGLANDEIGYLIPKAEWDDQPPWLQNRPEPWYGEINSVGPEAAAGVLGALVSLMQ